MVCKHYFLILCFFNISLTYSKTKEPYTSTDISSSRTKPRTEVKASASVPSSWTLPDPSLQPGSCGQTRPGPVCDPDHVLTPKQASELSAVLHEMALRRCNCSTVQLKASECVGVQMALAVVPRLQLADWMFPSSAEERLRAAVQCADYLRLSAWRLSACDDDAVLIMSVEDKQVWASMGSRPARLLMHHCVAMVHQKFNSHEFANPGNVLLQAVTEYRDIMLGVRECKFSSPPPVEGDPMLFYLHLTVGIGAGLMAMALLAHYYIKYRHRRCHSDQDDDEQSEITAL